MRKKIIYTFLLGAFFVYGFAVGQYDIFPFPQLLALKHYVENSTGTFEKKDSVQPPDSVEIHETFLQRLLVKKIQIPGFNGHGGGLSLSGDILYILTNKGSIQTYDIGKYSHIENDIEKVPMNFDGLILSGHPYRNNFTMPWFRVNGVYSETTDSDTQLLFVSHNGYDSEKDCITQNISRAELKISGQSVSQVDNWETIFTALPCIDPAPEHISSDKIYPGHISGGIIANYDDNRLLVSVGDYNRNGIEGIPEYAMDSSNPYGKYILVNKNSGNWSIYATGSRNASGLFMDRDSVIWSVENGPEGGDELNIVVKNENYGWPRVSFGIWYDHTMRLPGGQKTGTHPDYRKPVFSWVPSVAPRSITKIEDGKFDLWKGDLLLGTMRDQSLHRLRLGDDNQVVYDERIHLDHRIRDLITLADGKIVLLTDDGYLMIIDDGGSRLHKMDSDARKRMASLNKFNRISVGNWDSTMTVYESSSKAVFQQNCATCHNLSPGHNQIGPHLYKLLNRNVGEVDNFSYSKTLKSDERSWNAELLKSFLENPGKEFPGTQMEKINLSTNEIDSLIHFFKTRNWQTY